MVESYERNINGRKVTCKGYESRVYYEIFFNTLTQRDNFLDLYDEDDNYDLIDATPWNTGCRCGHEVYLDRIIVRSTKERRDKMVRELMLTEWTNKEKVINRTKLFRGGRYVKIYKV